MESLPREGNEQLEQALLGLHGDGHNHVVTVSSRDRNSWQLLLSGRQYRYCLLLGSGLLSWSANIVPGLLYWLTCLLLLLYLLLLIIFVLITVCRIPHFGWPRLPNPSVTTCSLLTLIFCLFVWDWGGHYLLRLSCYLHSVYLLHWLFWLFWLLLCLWLLFQLLLQF